MRASDPSSRAGRGRSPVLPVVVAFLLATAATLPAQEFRPLRRGDPPALAYTAPFFEGATYDRSVPPPEAVLGQMHATRLSHHGEIVELFRRWAAASDRMELFEHGRTHEDRELVHAVVSSPENLARLDAILADAAHLADPRGLPDGDADRLLDELPGIAWMGYSIHGDELSGADAAVALGYHLVASRDDDVARLLDELVVVIDPCMNPDGRERIVGMIEQSTGRVPILDYDTMQRGRWPWGRGNHYLFDMNRDWMDGTQPETRARWAAVRRYRPHLFVDAHEMGPLDTFLFYPQARPHNPDLPSTLDAWHGRFAAGQAAAFDRFGWTYYTREWADGWGPFYSDAWASLGGAVGILYEQASTAGFPLRDAEGRVRTYRESVHHQVVSSWANLRTLAERRRDVLADRLAWARAAVAADTPGNDEVFVLMSGRHPGREADLVAALVAQGVEVYRTTDHVTLDAARDREGRVHETLDVPPGSWLVPARQPERARVRSTLAFDVPMTEETLRLERRDLETKGETRIYDVTAWSQPLRADLEAYWATGAATGARVEAVEPSEGGLATGPGVAAPDVAVAFVVDGALDASVAFAARAMEAGLVVRLADEPFRTDGRSYPRGSVVARRSDNDAPFAARVETAAREAGVTAWPTRTARSPDDGPDLGGGHFLLLERPRVAMLSNMPVAPDVFGHLWHHLDREVGVPTAHLDAAVFGGADLRRYNVLVVPAGYGLGGVLEPMKESIAAWVAGGGTLVACGNAVDVFAREGGVGSVRRRRDVLDELDGWRVAARREREAREISVDVEALWAPPVAQGAGGAERDARAIGADADAEGAAGSDDDGSDDERPGDDGPGDDAGGPTPRPADATKDGDATRDPDAKRQDAWMRRFSPAGAIVRGLVDERHWITSGCDGELPVLVSGSTALVARDPVRTAVRLGPADGLRLSGLLWPEARERLAESAWLTVERVGRGQVVLFAATPSWRGQEPASARLFANAVVYGPGAGADAPIDW